MEWCPDRPARAKRRPRTVTDHPFGPKPRHGDDQQCLHLDP